MARSPKLKVFRLPVGFHDAYVAAPTKKAAIEAWGSDKDVFQRGQAELVEDPTLTREPLEKPGEVIKRLRGTAAEQIAALGETPERPERKGRTRNEKGAKRAEPKPAPRPKPRPSRNKLGEAEAALGEAEARHEEALAGLKAREAELARKRKALEQSQAEERARLEAKREKAEAAYEKAMRAWRG